MRHTDQRDEPKGLWGGFWLSFERRLKGLDRATQVSGLEEGKTKIDAQTRKVRVEAQAFVVEGDRLFVVFLARFKKAKMGVGFSRIRLGGEQRPPGGFSSDGIALLLERKSRLPLSFARGWRLAKALDYTGRRKAQHTD